MYVAHGRRVLASRRHVCERLGMVLAFLAACETAPAVFAKGGDERVSPEQVLAQYGLSSTTGDLMVALDHEVPLVRQMAVTILGSTAREALSRIRLMVHDEDPNVRISVGEALVAFGDRSGIDVIKEELDSGDALIRFRAGSTLCQYGHMEGSLVFAEAMESPRPMVRVLAIASLDRCPGLSARNELLEQGVTDESLEVRLAALGTIENSRRTADIRFLLAALEDATPEVRFNANRVLEEVTGQGVGFDPWASERERSKAVRAWKVLLGSRQGSTQSRSKEDGGFR